MWPFSSWKIIQNKNPLTSPTHLSTYVNLSCLQKILMCHKSAAAAGEIFQVWLEKMKYIIKLITYRLSYILPLVFRKMCTNKLFARLLYYMRKHLFFSSFLSNVSPFVTILFALQKLQKVCMYICLQFLWGGGNSVDKYFVWWKNYAQECSALFSIYKTWYYSRYRQFTIK